MLLFVVVVSPCQEEITKEGRREWNRYTALSVFNEGAMMLGDVLRVFIYVCIGLTMTK